MTQQPLRILLAALGGEGGGVLMNWIITAARNAGHHAQATSVPGVAQRTGSTSYYIEVGDQKSSDAVLSLVPLPGRVDAVVSSELIETARVMAAGFVSPNLTTLISSTARFYSTAEKIAMGDGRYSEDSVRKTAEVMAQNCFLLDLGQLAKDNATFVSATMYGALSGSGVLPWNIEHARSVLGDAKSRAGFDAAVVSVQKIRSGDQFKAPIATPRDTAQNEFAGLPNELATVLTHGVERAIEYQDDEYGRLFVERAQSLITDADLNDHQVVHALTEGCRRLALWMAYEDVARVADLKTRPERFERIRKEVKLAPGQILNVTEYMKPRAEEIADILPRALGNRIMGRVKNGGKFPFLGKGRYIRSNGIIGYRLLRLVAGLKRIRRKSLRFFEEQSAIENWLSAMRTALKKSPDFAVGLAELPRVLKGYSDTLMRGKTAYSLIMEQIVQPAVTMANEKQQAAFLRHAISVALSDDSHEKLNALLAEQIGYPNTFKKNEVEDA